MPDEGLHEIQLNGKQLVFLFMAATVVAVVIFLCGVMVGRGVPTPRGATIADTAGAAADPTASAQAAPFPIATSNNTPVTAGETLTYPERLEDPDPVLETLKPTAEPIAVASAPAPVVEAAVARAPAPAVAKTPVPAPAVAKAPISAVARPTAAPVADKGPAEPAGNGFVVQVAATRARSEADAMARRLSAKGYPTFVTTAGTNFRVRIGKYNDRREAESIASRLEKEEELKPWITR